MPKKISSSNTTTALKSKILEYLTNNPNKSMQETAAYFELNYRTFRKFVFAELGEQYWNIKKPEKKVRDPKILSHIKTAYQQNSETVRGCYSLYCAIPDAVMISEKVFRSLCKENGYLFQLASPQKYRLTEYETIFADHRKEVKVNTRTFRRSFHRLVLSVTDPKVFLMLDPTLTFDHLERYVKIKENNCWTCGKTKHINLPVRLEIDHISGNSCDNRLSNLRLVCACCHKLTENHSKRKSKSFVAKNRKTSVYAYFEENVDLELMKRMFIEETE